MYANLASLIARVGIERVGFVTLTTADNCTDGSEGLRRYRAFAAALLRPNRIESLCVPERQQRGAIHFHVSQAVTVTVDQCNGSYNTQQVNAGPSSTNMNMTVSNPSASQTMDAYWIANGQLLLGMSLPPGEAWQFYPNNGGWSRSPILPFYARQQRKLRDEWYIITQHPTDVDSVVWNIAQDFMVCRNHGMERMGIFRQPEIFRVLTYVTNPAKGNAIISHESIHRLDRKRLAQCYDTTAGVGITGGFKGDANQQRKGIHISWAVAGIALAVGGLVALPHFLGQAASGWIGHVTAPPKSATQWAGIRAGIKPLLKEPVKFADASAPASPEFRGPMPAATNAPAPSDDVYCTGFCIFSNGPVIFLSDGTVLEGQADGIESVSPTAVFVRGKKYVVRRYRPAPCVPASPVDTAGGTGQPQTTITYQEQKPVNQAIILPAIHAQGGTPPPRLNGIGEMNRRLSQGRQNEQN